jgi:hypothetical protein
MHFAELRGGGDGRESRVLQLAIFMFNQDERLHPTTPVSRNLSISSSTEPTLIPACRLEGSVTFTGDDMEIQEQLRDEWQ